MKRSSAQPSRTGCAAVVPAPHARKLGVSYPALKDWKRRDFCAYVEGYYNRQRRHSALGYQTPLDFESNVN